MTDMEAALFSALSGFVSSRMYPNEFPQAPDVPAWPAIRYTFIDTAFDADVTGDAEDDDTDIRVQLDLVAIGYTEVRALREQVRARMRTFAEPVLCVSEFNLKDPETKTHRCTLDYIIYQTSDGGNSP